MPTFNRPEGLRRALDCICGQTYRNLEVIVSDNASEDADAYAFMKEYCRVDPRVRYFRQDSNIGAHENFKFVLQAATGEYFLWFADDDLCAKDYIAALSTELQKDPDIILCSCDVSIIDRNDQELTTERIEALYRGNNWPRTRRLFFQYPISNVFYSIYGMFRTADLRREKHGLQPGWKGLNVNTEIPLLASIATLGEIRAIPHALKIYRSHDKSVFAREFTSLSGCKLFRIKLFIRRRLIAILIRSELSLAEKLILLGSTVFPQFRRLLSKART